MTEFRSAKGSRIDWFPTDGAFSNFEFVDTRFGSHPIVRRILSLVRKLDYKGLLLEKIDESGCDLLAEENAAMARRLPTYQRSEVFRLSFFSRSDESAPGSFLGYAVVKQDWVENDVERHIYEAVLTPPRQRRENNFIHCLRTYEVATCLGRFSARGVLYAQQNDATFVCAHVALRTLLSTILPEGDVTYFRINTLAGVDHGDPYRRVGRENKGLGPAQIEAVLRGLGLNPQFNHHEPGHGIPMPADVEFQRLLYGYLESNRPVLLGFELAPDPQTGKSPRHIIPVLGHTFNEDLWVPEAERHYFAHNRGYFPSESWLSAYVCHDDNFGPYVCLPRHYLQRDSFRLLVGLYPPGVDLPPDEAEAVALDFVTRATEAGLYPGIAWLDRLTAFCRANLIVLRTLCVDREAYVGHLRGLRDRERFDLEPDLVDRLAGHLPAQLWMVEVSAPELFPASRRKFGEVLVAVEPRGPAGLPQVVGARLPGAVFFVQGSDFNPERTRLAGHTDLFPIPTRNAHAHLDRQGRGREPSPGGGRLVRERFAVRDLVEQRIDACRRQARAKAFQEVLFAEETGAIKVSAAEVFALDPDRYPARWICGRSGDFKKHYHRQIGELGDKGEEFECALFLDQLPQVKTWVRNLERQPEFSFWLPTATDRFYPDFVCQLADGRWLVVESKGEDRWSNDASREKRRIGELWAERSGGGCLFIMPQGKDFAAIQRLIGRAT